MMVREGDIIECDTPDGRLARTGKVYLDDGDFYIKMLWGLSADDCGLWDTYLLRSCKNINIIGNMHEKKPIKIDKFDPFCSKGKNE